MKPTVSEQDDLRTLGQLRFTHRRIKRREEHILRHHACTGDMIEQCRLAGICITDQGNNRIRHASPALPVQTTGPRHGFKFPAQRGYPVLNDAPVGFDLRFAGTAEKTETTALALQMRPGSTSRLR